MKATKAIYSDEDKALMRKHLQSISDYSEILLDRMIEGKEDLTVFLDDKNLIKLKKDYAKLVSNLKPIRFEEW